MSYLDTSSVPDLQDLCQETSSRLKVNPVVAEKDYWPCWVLDRLFSDPPVRGQIMFKDGTTLSKVFGLIERFSENIDMILNWDMLKEKLDPVEGQNAAKGGQAQQAKRRSIKRVSQKKSFTVQFLGLWGRQFRQ